MELGNSTVDGALETNEADIIGINMKPTSTLTNILRFVIAEKTDKGLRHLLSIFTH